MGARTHRELEAWKKANELRRRVLAFTDRPEVARDQDFCKQIRKAINSACHNTSEGFYKYNHALFAQAVRVARGELGEVDDQLEAARQSNHLGEEEYEDLSALCAEALALNGGLLSHLEGRSKKRRERTAPRTGS